MPGIKATQAGIERGIGHIQITCLVGTTRGRVDKACGLPLTVVEPADSIAGQCADGTLWRDLQDAESPGIRGIQIAIIVMADVGRKAEWPTRTLDGLAPILGGLSDKQGYSRFTVWVDVRRTAATTAHHAQH